MPKLNLLNRLIKEPNCLDLELLTLLRNQKMSEDGFRLFLDQLENSIEIDIVLYFIKGSSLGLWQDLLDYPKFIELGAMVWLHCFETYDSYYKGNGKLRRLNKLFSEIEKKDIIKFLIEYKADREGTKMTIQFLFKELSLKNKNELFIFNLASNSELYFSFKDYLGDWNLLLDGEIPLYFEYFSCRINIAEDLKYIFKEILQNLQKFNLTLKYENLNFCQFFIKKVFLNFSGEAIYDQVGLFKFLNILLKKTEFSDTLILTYLKSELGCLHPKIFSFIFNRWIVEKQYFSSNAKIEILESILVGFDQINIIDHFIEDLREIEKQLSGVALFDRLDVFSSDLDFNNPKQVIQKLVKYNFSLKSKRMVKLLEKSIQMYSLGEISLSDRGFPALVYLLKKEPYNYMFLNYSYLRTMLSMARIKDENYNKVADLIRSGEFFKNKVFNKIPLNWQKNIGFAKLFYRLDLVDTGIVDCLYNFENELAFIKNIIGSKSAYAQKIFRSYIIVDNKLHYPNLFWFYMLKNAGFNYDRRIFFILRNNLKISIENFRSNFLLKLRVFFSEEAILKIISKSQNKKNLKHLMSDANESLDFIINNNLLELAKNKLHNSSNLVDLHNRVSQVIKFVTQDNFKLEQNLLLSLDGHKIKDYTISVPQNNHTLIEIGKTLHICVGDGNYGQQLKKKRIFIIALKSPKGSYSHCIEIDRGTLTILQAKTFHNRQMGESLMELINHKLFLLR